MKDRRSGGKSRGPTSLLHTSELQDGQDWDRIINLQSITEQSHVDEFLSTAELAGTEFQAVKLNVKFVHPSLRSGMPTAEEKKKIEAAQAANVNMLKIPRRPEWNLLTTPEQLAEAERNSFLTWRRGLAQLQEVDGITLTPFEKNLEFWRQLWRVIERSDVLVQIVDARNPLLFRCEDLETYVKEVSPHKDNLLLVNKSDFLTDTQREVWAEYFRKHGIKAVFFSALAGQELDQIEEEEGLTLLTEIGSEDCTEEKDSGGKADGDTVSEDGLSTEAVKECEKDIQHLSQKLQEQDISTGCASSSSEPTSPSLSCTVNPPPSTTTLAAPTEGYVTTSHLMSCTELMDVLRRVHTGPRVSGKVVTIGLVGYPNVGKSSTINCLMQAKKVSVSATPGKTKHFQTLYLSEDILLCDCPGLVFPAFVTTKQEMIISGILPIDQMRDEVPPMNLVASRIPRQVFEGMYGITLPKPREGEDSDRPPTSEEVLNAYGFMRGFMTQRGLPDNPRTARYLLKDYVNGRLLFCHAPPGVPQDQYHTPHVTKTGKGGMQAEPTPQQKRTQPYAVQPEAIDRQFFGAPVASYHLKGINRGPTKMSSVQAGEGSAPRGKLPRQKNLKKREKLRRRFAYLDN